MSNPDSISFSLITQTPDPIAAVLPGPRAICSCGWMGKPRWFIYGARIDAQIHHTDTGHDLAVPLVWRHG